MSGYSLIIDTSIHGAAVGLQNNAAGCLEFVEASTDVADSARQLPLIVEKGLSEIGLRKEDVNRVLVSQGPGSFTGIRVGLSYAIGFLAGLNSRRSISPLIAGVSSLGLLAKSLAKESGGGVLVFLPSTKTTGYLAEVLENNVAVSSIDLSRIPPEKIFLDHQNYRSAIIGDWVSVFDEAKKHGAQSPSLIESRAAAIRSIKIMGEFINSGLQNRWVDLQSGQLPTALYLRKSTVEEKALETH